MQVDPSVRVMAAPDCRIASQRMSLDDREEWEFMESAWTAALDFRAPKVTGAKVIGVRVMGLKVMGVTHVS